MTIEEVRFRNPPLKVLFLTSSYPRNREDTAGIFLHHLARHLTRRGLAVDVLVPAESTRKTWIQDGVTVHQFPYFFPSMQRLTYGSGILHNLKQTPWLWIEVPFLFAAMACAAVRLARREKPDLIHAHWLVPQGLVALLAKLLCGVPIVVTAHGSDAFRLKGLDFLKTVVLRRSNAWTANTLATAQAVRAEGLAAKRHIIPMGVEVRRFRSGDPKRLRTGLASGGFILLFVGRIVEGKGLDVLFESFTLLPFDLRKQTSIWVVGGGLDRGPLERYARDAVLDGTIRFWGEVSQDRLPDFYAAADLLIIPSNAPEGQGVVALESFAAGLCVVATRTGGVEEVVDDGVTGMLVEPGNAQVLAHAIEKLLIDADMRRRLADNAFLRVQKEYDWEIIATRFHALYQEILQGNADRNC